MHEHVDVQISRQSHDDWKQKNKNDYNANKRGYHTSIKLKYNDESEYAYCNIQTVTYVHGTKKKRRLDLIAQTTMTAFFMHIKNSR